MLMGCHELHKFEVIAEIIESDSFSAIQCGYIKVSLETCELGGGSSHFRPVEL